MRTVYKKCVHSIKNSVNKNLPLEQQAKQAFSLRNTYRNRARDLMEDVQARKQLDARRPNKAFDELLKGKMERKGLTKEEALKDIIETASKTNKGVDDLLK